MKEHVGLEKCLTQHFPK